MRCDAGRQEQKTNNEKLFFSEPLIGEFPKRILKKHVREHRKHQNDADNLPVSHTAANENDRVDRHQSERRLEDERTKNDAC